jgi:hypothetical protein
MTIGMETSTDTAQLIAPAGVAGVVGLKPTVGLVSRTGVLPVARSQDAPGSMGRSVYDVASMESNSKAVVVAGRLAGSYSGERRGAALISRCPSGAASGCGGHR